MASILDLSSSNASAFLMASDSYCTTDMPDYIDFWPVLKFAKTRIKDLDLREVTEAAAGQTDVNYCILSNKDGGYGVRPLSLANPFLYAMMVRDLCEKDSWERIKKCFKLYSSDSITACSLPQVPPAKKKEAFPNATQILNWWSQMEQLPIELSMDYRYMFMTDITNCFGEITPETIQWALSLKGTSDETEENQELAQKLISGIAAMQSGKKVGIPQGSKLFALIAEIVLGYADRLLHDTIEKEGITEDYRVLRYVDDYRIFCNDRDVLERISYILQEVLEKLNFRMNTKKTRISDTIVTDAMKPDKAFYIFNTPIMNKKGVDFDGLAKHLYFIYEFGEKFPNSGQLKRMMSEFSERLETIINEADSKKNKGKEEEKPEDTQESEVKMCDDDFFGAEVDLGLEEEDKKDEEGKKTQNIFEKAKLYVVKNRHGVYERIPPMVAICVRIAAHNVSVAHYALRIVSQFLAIIDDKEERAALCERVYNSLIKIPNTSDLQIWLQAITYGLLPKETKYEAKLCGVVEGKKVSLWNNNWLPKETVARMPISRICNKKKLKENGNVIKFRERPDYTEKTAAL